VSQVVVLILNSYW